VRYLFLLLLYCFSSSLFSQYKDWEDSLAFKDLKTYTAIPSDSNDYGKVEKLVLNKAVFKSFPLTILKFKNLKYLDLSNHRIDSLPETFTEFKKLIFFKCGKCQLKKLPSTMAQMKALKYLMLYKNKLESLPENFESLSQLKIVDLWHNDFTGVPEALYKMPFLKILDIRNISLNRDKINRLNESFPNTKVYHDPSCNCPGE
jgi:Leucine-rich repeat (LRR) protein